MPVQHVRLRSSVVQNPTQTRISTPKFFRLAYLSGVFQVLQLDPGMALEAVQPMRNFAGQLLRILSDDNE